MQLKQEDIRTVWFSDSRENSKIYEKKKLFFLLKLSGKFSEDLNSKIIFCLTIKENLVPDSENFNKFKERESFLITLQRINVFIFRKKITILFNLTVAKMK